MSLQNNCNLKSSTNFLSEMCYKPVSIIIPVYKAAADLCKCIKSIYENTTFPFQIILIDDASNDEKINKLCEDYSVKENFKVLKNEKNLGYIKSINLGVTTSENDVVLLNSDTIVTKGWLKKLYVCAYNDSKIMTVTPFSNAAGAFSVPGFCKNKNLPRDISLEDMSRIVEHASKHELVRVPTGNGFCMYIKRKAFEDIGLFDEVSFGKGYCEENDFCMRLIHAGFYNIIADDVFIFHRRNASFGRAKQNLLKKNMKIILKRYPEYPQLVRKGFYCRALKRTRLRIRIGILQHRFTKKFTAGGNK